MKKIIDNDFELESYHLPEKTITKEEYCDQIINTYYNTKHETFTKAEYKNLYHSFLSGDKDSLEKIRKKSLLLGLEPAKNIYCNNLFDGEFEDIVQDCLMIIYNKINPQVVNYTKGYLCTLKYVIYLYLDAYLNNKENNSYKKNRDLWYEKNKGKVISYDESIDEICSSNDLVEDVILQKDLKLNLKDGIQHLQPNQQKVIIDDFFERIDKKQISKELSVSYDDILQIENKALKKLRHPSLSKKFKDYLK